MSKHKDKPAKRLAARIDTYWAPNSAAPKQTESRYNKPGSNKSKHSLGKRK